MSGVSASGRCRLCAVTITVRQTGHPLRATSRCPVCGTDVPMTEPDGGAADAWERAKESEETMRLVWRRQM